jgi:exopolyphosphatase / guanosine-5'-triphosphate,3'-diphosphate pyrophosphatase
VAINTVVPKRILFHAAGRIAAIDVGSNAIRMAIAEVRPGKQFRVLKTMRWPVRLGHHAFLRRRLDGKMMSAAARAFREAGDLFEKFGVQRYRAVATSAAREARNSGALVRKLSRDTGIRLEVISSEEEARLMRTAVLGTLGKSMKPRLILDLGGGSIELCLMRRGEVQRTVALPLGTVRLLESFHLHGAISEEDAEELAHYARMMLDSYWPNHPPVLDGSAVACGGNAEALARLFPGPRWSGINTLNLQLMRDRLWNILRLDVDARMDEFRVRRDRAEVIGVAAIVLATFGSWLRIRSFLVPGVGVREGILRDLASASSTKRPEQKISAPGTAEFGVAYASANR